MVDDTQVITKVNCCSFRIDGKSVVFGSDSGYKMYDITEAGLQLKQEGQIEGGVKLISEISNSSMTQGR